MAGDALRISARTPKSVLPRARRVSAAEALRLAPAIAQNGLRGGLVAYDGQLIDDARLVVTLARTAAEHGATVLTRVRAEQVTGTGARLVDTMSDTSIVVSARAVISATGVWAGEVDPSVRLRPFVFAMPEQLGRVYLGLTDEDAPGPIPDEPVAEEHEVTFLLDTINQALGTGLTRGDVIGTYSGLRPLIDTGGGSTADVSRKHAVTVGPSGIISIIGGKLTTYRQMAEDVVDRAVSVADLNAKHCTTAQIPLVGAPTRSDSAATAGLPSSLVARHGGLSRTVVDAATVNAALEPIAPGIDVTRAEVEYAVTHEGAIDASDVLDRRTRIGLVRADADAARAAVEEIVISRSS